MKWQFSYLICANLFLLRDTPYILLLISSNITSISDDLQIFSSFLIYSPFSVFRLPSDIFIEYNVTAAQILSIYQWDYNLIYES